MVDGIQRVGKDGDRDDSPRISWLEVFVTVARERNYDLAAAHHGCHRRTITKRIDALESWLGLELVVANRPGSRDPVELTPRGHVILESAKRIVRDIYACKKPIKLEDMFKIKVAVGGVQKIIVTARNVGGTTVFEID